MYQWIPPSSPVTGSVGASSQPSFLSPRASSSTGEHTRRGRENGGGRLHWRRSKGDEVAAGLLLFHRNGDHRLRGEGSNYVEGGNGHVGLRKGELND